MNYYERIERTINYIEENLDSDISIKEAAKAAYMSESNCYRMFLAIVGYSIKEYVRLRCMHLAAKDLLQTDIKVIDIGVKYSYESTDSFSRAFRNATGSLPSSFRREKHEFSFERIDIMDKYFELQTSKDIEEYPDIKILKSIQSMKVAYYCYFGEDPETHAFQVIYDWLAKNHIDLDKTSSRIFGYNNPSPDSPEQKEYGYEVCITIDENLLVNDEMIQTKYLEGGLYAVTSVKRSDNLGLEIMKGWQRFKQWLSGSKYTYGGHQWLEEHLVLPENPEQVVGIDLYMPIAERSEISSRKEIVTVEPMHVVTFTATGRNAEKDAKNYFFEWALKQKLFEDGKPHRIFSYYNFQRIGQKDFFYTMNVSVDKDFITNDDSMKKDIFSGGFYSSMSSKYRYNGQAWNEFMDWIARNEQYDVGDYWFFEEYLIKEAFIELDTDMRLFMPIKEKC
jgi:DNA gyrase inhibitor GyrI/AraC-like DNA-binding protein